jgi:hypothetical protein
MVLPQTGHGSSALDASQEGVRAVGETWSAASVSAGAGSSRLQNRQMIAAARISSAQKGQRFILGTGKLAGGRRARRAAPHVSQRQRDRTGSRGPTPAQLEHAVCRVSRCAGMNTGPQIERH